VAPGLHGGPHQGVAHVAGPVRAGKELPRFGFEGERNAQVLLEERPLLGRGQERRSFRRVLGDDAVT
jgi:hypothetical protein